MLTTGPKRMSLPLMRPIIMYILQSSVAILKWLVMLLMYIPTCMRRPIAMCMWSYSRMYIHICLVQPPMQRSHQNHWVIAPPQGATEVGPPGYHPPHGPPRPEFSFSGPPPGYTPKRITIVPRGVTFKDCTFGTLMIGEILTPK